MLSKTPKPIDTQIHDAMNGNICRSEMGQDGFTSLRMILAEELGVDPRKVTVLHAEADPLYVNTALGAQIAGGSTSVREGWDPLHKAGASARETLIAAAAAQWGVNASECKAVNGVVTHGARSATHGSLTAAALRTISPCSAPFCDRCS